MNIEKTAVSHIANDQELAKVHELLDSFEANLGEYSLEQYFSAKNAAINYVAERLSENPDWTWPSPGAIEDIVSGLRRSMETQARMQKPSKQELLTEAYLAMMPAANKLAA